MVRIKNEGGEISITNDVLTYLAGDAARSEERRVGKEC